MQEKRKSIIRKGETVRLIMIEKEESTAMISGSQEGRRSLPEKNCPTLSTIIPSLASSFAIDKPERERERESTQT